MVGKYNLEWLYLAVNVTLNPSKTNLSDISDEQIRDLTFMIDNQTVGYQLQLVKDIFSLLDDNKINILINQYHIIGVKKTCVNAFAVYQPQFHMFD